MKSTAGLFIRISSEESYAKEVENIRFSCIAGCKKAGYCVAQYPELFRGGNRGSVAIHDGDGKIREITNCNRKRIFGAGVRGRHSVIGIKMFIGF